MEILAGGGFGRKGMVPTIVGMSGNRKGEPRDGRGKGQVAELYIEIANNRDTKEIPLPPPVLDIGHKKHFKRQKWHHLINYGLSRQK